MGEINDFLIQGIAEKSEMAQTIQRLGEIAEMQILDSEAPSSGEEPDSQDSVAEDLDKSENFAEEHTPEESASESTPSPRTDSVTSALEQYRQNNGDAG